MFVYNARFPLVHIHGATAPKRRTQMHEPPFQRAERAPPVDLVLGFEGSEQILHGCALLAGTDEPAAAECLRSRLEQLLGDAFLLAMARLPKIASTN